jgi:predicted alpha/beta-fold hydrolase
MNKFGTWKTFTPSPWALTARAQTLFGNLNWSHSNYSRNEYVIMPDNIQILLEWKDTIYMSSNTPIIVCLYGVAGSGKSKVAIDLTNLVFARGWRSVIYNRRGHGASSLLPINNNESVTKIFPMHADMEDMEVVVQYIRKTYPKAPMVLVGFSVGSNAVVKYLGENNKTNPFIGGISICNGFDLVKLTKNFTPIANLFMINAMRTLVFAKQDEINHLASTHKINWNIIKKTNSARDFETALMLPIYNQFKTLDDFLLANSCQNALKDVAVPLLCMAALDDPLIHPDISLCGFYASQINPNIFYLATKKGGHLGWLAGWQGSSWMMTVIMQFIETINM